ncbi:acyl-CoA dehydrogenase family protein [Sphingomonas profundi]|uniref:acyl-CoA dehydrogenase family protein n=1 Tax=Alterirhizorhabdus profundi TaxID=2681549 RepID=UPI0012E6FF58|nr:acyl-CoA dehydrogenase family protein [Sphingomonas profundi]
MDMDDALLDPFKRLLERISTAQMVRASESAGEVASWVEIDGSGFVDALVPEAAGGVGLSLADVVPLLLAAGGALLPVALGETMVARALVARAGKALPVTTPVLLWPADQEGRPRSLIAPALAGATHAFVQQGKQASVRPLMQGDAAPDGFGIVAARLDPTAAPLLVVELPEDALFAWAAALTAATMAGAMARVLEMTMAHVNDRQQFGRPLGKFQAIQQQMSMLAEAVAMADVAARIGLTGRQDAPSRLDAAIAKTVADESATTVCAIAHAAHGAIGITREHDLSLYVRRLKRWQLSFGSAAGWSRIVGEARLVETGNSVDFIRAMRHD